MTLLACVLTPDYVVLCADRRLSIKENGGYRVAEDEECKIVVYNMFSIWAYTGPARINNQPTAQWLTQELSGFKHRSYDLAISYIAKRLGQVIAPIPREFSRLTVISVGYMYFPELSGLTPVMAKISNFEQPDGKFTMPKSKFLMQRSYLPDANGWYFTTCGQSLSHKQNSCLRRSISRPIERNLHPSYVYPIFHEQFCRISRALPLVGERILIASIFKEQARRSYEGKDNHYLVGPDFMYFGPDAKRGLYYGPNFATTGGGAIVNLRGGSMTRAEALALAKKPISTLT